MTVEVGRIISGVGVVIIVIDVSRRLRVVVGLQIRMVFLDAVIEDGDCDPLSSDPSGPCPGDVHVEVMPAIHVPHLVPKRIIEHWLGGSGLRPQKNITSFGLDLRAEWS